MKTSIMHLPKEKQQELHELVRIIREYYQKVEMILLFGSYARGDWVEEKTEDGIHFKYQSDFDIFVVTEIASQATKIESDHLLRKHIIRIIQTPISIFFQI